MEEVVLTRSNKQESPYRENNDSGFSWNRTQKMYLAPKKPLYTPRRVRLHCLTSLNGTWNIKLKEEGGGVQGLVIAFSNMPSFFPNWFLKTAMVQDICKTTLTSLSLIYCLFFLNCSIKIGIIKIHSHTTDLVDGEPNRNGVNDSSAVDSQQSYGQWAHVVFVADRVLQGHSTTRQAGHWLWLRILSVTDHDVTKTRDRRLLSLFYFILFGL